MAENDMLPEAACYEDRTYLKPAAILDVSKVRRHCENMLDAVEKLGIGLRAHVKTHKTTEVAEMQVGQKSHEARFAVSTVAEIRHMLPMLQRLQRSGRRVNVLYEVPLPASQVDRLVSLAKQLGPGSITLMIDHISHLSSLLSFCHRHAGLPADVLNRDQLVQKLSRLHTEGLANFVGIYSHSSLKYISSRTDLAVEALVIETDDCFDVVYENLALLPKDRPLVFSVGPSPSATAIQNLTDHGYPEGTNPWELDVRLVGSENLSELRSKLATKEIHGIRVILELNAGVYSIMDMEQMSIRSVGSMGPFDNEIALSVLAEVVSVYNNGGRDNPEALVAAGTLPLGREPSQFYDGWGFVAPEPNTPGPYLIVERIYQEHSILSSERLLDYPYPDRGMTLAVGDIVRIYPNHACITGAMYDQYYVVDSSDASNGQRVTDVWTRARGW